MKKKIIKRFMTMYFLVVHRDSHQLLMSTGERVVAGQNSHYFYYKIGYKQYAFPKVLHNIFQFNRHVL